MQYGDYSIGNVVRTHPVAYSMSGDRRWSTAVSGPSISYMDFTFDRDFNFMRVVVEGGMASG